MYYVERYYQMFLQGEYDLIFISINMIFISSADVGSDNLIFEKILKVAL